MEWVNVLIQGVLLGGLYALFAAGLSLMFGVMRFVNIAHGDFIVLAAYLMLSFVTFMGWHPALGIMAVVLVMERSVIWGNASCSTGCWARIFYRPFWSPLVCRSSCKTA